MPLCKLNGRAVHLTPAKSDMAVEMPFSHLYNPYARESIFLGMRIDNCPYLILDCRVLNVAMVGTNPRLQRVVNGDVAFMALGPHGVWRKKRFRPDLRGYAVVANAICDDETGQPMERKESSREQASVEWSGVRGVVVLILSVHYLIFTSEASLQPPTAPLVPQAYVHPGERKIYVDGRLLAAEDWLAANAARLTKDELLAAKKAWEDWLAEKAAEEAARDLERESREVELIESFDDDDDAAAASV